MSRWNDKAEQLKTVLEGLGDLEGIPVFVHREDNLLAAVNTRTAKAAGGGCVVVKWLGGSNPDPGRRPFILGARFSISLWTRKILSDAAAVPADDLIEEMAAALHGWTDSASGALRNRLRVESVAVVPDAPGFIVHEILAGMERVAPAGPDSPPWEAIGTRWECL